MTQVDAPSYAYFSVENFSREVSISDVLATAPAFLIGSDPRCHLPLTSPSVASSHAVVDWRGDGYYLAPRFQHLPVLVNGKPVRVVTRLNPDDRVTVGETTLTFGLSERPAALVPASSIVPARQPAQQAAFQPVTPLVTAPARASLSAQVVGQNVYFPSTAQAGGASLTGMFFGLAAMLVIAVVVGFGLIGGQGFAGLGQVRAASNADTRFAYGDGNVTMVMFDADW